MKNGKICEVAQKFIIDIEQPENGNIPITFGLYKDVNCTEKIEQGEDGNYTSDEFDLKAGTEEVKTMYLKISWLADEKNEELAFEIGYFRINIIVTQKD